MAPPENGVDSNFDKRLRDLPSVAAPLYLVMAGVRAVEEGLPTLLMCSQTEMAQRLAVAELDRITKMARDHEIEPGLSQFLVAGVTLVGGISRSDLRRWIGKECKALGYTANEFAATILALGDMLGGDGQHLDPVLPDLVGEALLITKLKPLPEKNQQEFIARWFERSRRTVPAALVRATQDYLTEEAPLRWLEGITSDEDIDTLQVVSAALPESSVRLQDLTRKINQQIVRRAGPAGEGYPLIRMLRLVEPLSRLAVASAQAGKHLEAYEHFSRAVELFKPLMLLTDEEMAQTRPPIIASKYAWLLNGLGNQLSALGRNEEAIDIHKKAVELTRLLARHQGSSFDFQLGAFLNNLSVTFQDLGRYEQAVESSWESVSLLREYIAGGGDEKGTLAMTLNNLGNQLAALGNHGEACTIAREAVTLYHELAAGSPDVFRRGLAMAVYNLSFKLAKVGRTEDAIAAASEAVEVYRVLAELQADTFRPELASALDNLATNLARSGRYDDAYELAQEAVKYYQELSGSRPESYLKELASASDNLAQVLRGSGKLRAACDSLAGVLSIYRRLSSAQPDLFRRDLADTGARLGQWLIKAEQFDAALLRFKEAAGEYGQLAQAHPEAFRPVLAKTLCFLSACLYDGNRRSEAFDAAEEAIRQLGPIFLSTPTEHCRWMNLILYTYTGLLVSTDRESEAEVTDLGNSIALKLGDNCREEIPLALSMVYYGHKGPQPLPVAAPGRAARTLLAYAEGRVTHNATAQP